MNYESSLGSSETMELSSIFLIQGRAEFLFRFVDDSRARVNPTQDAFFKEQVLANRSTRILVRISSEKTCSFEGISCTEIQRSRLQRGLDFSGSVLQSCVLQIVVNKSLVSCSLSSSLSSECLETRLAFSFNPACLLTHSSLLSASHV